MNPRPSIYRPAILLVLLLLAVPAAAQFRPAEPSGRPDSLELARDSILAAAAANIARDSSQVDDFYTMAQIYKARKSYAQQLLIATRMVAANPGSALAHFILGDAELDNSYPARAIPALKRALQLEPTFVRARVTLAETYEIARQVDSALMHLDTALQHNPRHAQAHIQRAKLLSQQGRHAEAVYHYREASELLTGSPSAFDAWLKLASSLMKTGEYNDALDALTYCLKLVPESAEALITYADASAAAGRTDEAVQAYQQFMYRFPRHPRAMDAERTARSMGWRP